MQRQRGELIHIGEVFGGLDGTVQATRDASPQAALTRAACPPMGVDLPPRTSPPSKLDSGPFEVHSTG